MASLSRAYAHATHRQAAKDAWDILLRSRFDAATVGLDLLDVELDVLWEQLFSARTKRNAYTMACKVPAEVLTSIFMYTQAVWKPSRTPRPEDEDGGCTYGAGWMAVTKVCHSWRKVALSTPVLWSDIDCPSFHPGSIMEIVSRSKALPLSLNISGSATKADLEGWLCGPVNRRTKRLVVSACPRPDFFGWVELLYPAMPNLELLNINVSAKGDDDPINRLLPIRFLAGSCPPRLKSLYLDGVLCRWDSPLLSPNLSYLHMSTFDEYNILPTEVTSMLAPLVNLRSLGLWNILPPAAGTISLPVPQNTMLRVLDLRATRPALSSSIPAFLDQHPTWPASKATVAVRFANPADERDVTNTIPLLFNPRENDISSYELYISRSAISILYGDHWPRPRWKTKLDRLNFFKSSAVSASAFFRHLDVTYPNAIGNIAITQNLHQLPQTSLQALYVGRYLGPTIGGEDAWIVNFRSATDIRRVSGYYSELLGLICALGVQDSESKFMLFPNLAVLIFHADPSAIGPNMETEGNQEIQGTDGSVKLLKNNVALLDLLAVRKALGTEVKEVMVDKALKGWGLWNIPALRDATSVTFF